MSRYSAVFYCTWASNYRCFPAPEPVLTGIFLYMSRYSRMGEWDSVLQVRECTWLLNMFTSNCTLYSVHCALYTLYNITFRLNILYTRIIKFIPTEKKKSCTMQSVFHIISYLWLRIFDWKTGVFGFPENMIINRHSIAESIPINWVSNPFPQNL